jgi:hypothetical protein
MDITKAERPNAIHPAAGDSIAHPRTVAAIPTTISSTEISI